MIKYLGLHNKIFSKLLKLEIEYEFNSLYLNKNLSELLKKINIPYLFASDMYLEKKHISELFKKFKLKLNPIEILVSSSLRLSKRNSGIYVHLKNKYPNTKFCKLETIGLVILIMLNSMTSKHLDKDTPMLNEVEEFRERFSLYIAYVLSSS